MLKKIFVGGLSLLLSISFSVSVFAKPKADSNIVFSTTPDAQEQKRLEQYTLTPGTAYEIDVHGIKKMTEYKVVNAKSGEVTTQWTDGNGYIYTFDSYVQNNYSTDPKRFYVSDVSVYNNSSQSIPIKYIQNNSVTTGWSVSANIQAEGSLKAAFLGKLSYSVGVTYTDSKTTTSSTTVELGPINVPARKAGKITKYRAGGYGAGQAAWRKYSPSGTSYIGMYYTGESGWAVNPNSTTLAYTEWSI
ncbi:hypothetical protein [Marinicrinis sediminis]|uniref:Uncharacterized protein n=1 Tax=Marinicrinis sediminis TaxID=1652465 RepID=A0ABW5R8K4_9BACL